MVTYYTDVPTLEQRSRAVPLIVVGTIGPVVDTEVEMHADATYVRTVFTVRVDETLKGRSAEEVTVQVLGGRTEAATTPMELPVREGESMVLMLAESDTPGVYVPYLGSAFPVRGAVVELGEGPARSIEVEHETAAETQVRLDQLRDIIAEDVREGQDAAAEQQGEAPEPPAVREMPSGLEGGGSSGTPEAADDATAP